MPPEALRRWRSWKVLLQGSACFLREDKGAASETLSASEAAFCLLSQRRELEDAAAAAEALIANAASSTTQQTQQTTKASAAAAAAAASAAAAAEAAVSLQQYRSQLDNLAFSMDELKRAAALAEQTREAASSLREFSASLPHGARLSVRVDTTALRRKLSLCAGKTGSDQDRDREEAAAESPSSAKRASSAESREAQEKSVQGDEKPSSATETKEAPSDLFAALVELRFPSGKSLQSSQTGLRRPSIHQRLLLLRLLPPACLFLFPRCWVQEDCCK